MAKLQKEDYTVAWICALPVPEWQASRLLFDDEHEDPDLSGNIHYQYAFGLINGHNVVMGCLPASQMGLSSAASVASEMRSTFPALRFALLVGVGGGVPSSEKDIRLGDVVVSLPDQVRQHGGVIQYDYGKAVPDGRLVSTGMLNMPPHILLSALGKVQSGSAKNSKFDEYLQSYRSFAEDTPEFVDPPKLDKLFQSNYVHPALEATCRRCDKKFEIERAPRESKRPKVHYGTIASGNQVIKDSIKRDLISKEHNDVLCFEMEAAGLMNAFPCLVIRGICDYCDSHKNKVWQPYAAATAAAWAKELLRNVRAVDVSSGDTIIELSKQSITRNLNMLPYERDKDFVGREEIMQKIEDQLLDAEAHSRVALVGLGGVGKSQIAIECGWRLLQHRGDISVFWVYASSPERVYLDYQSIARRVELEGHKDPTKDHLQIVRDWLNSDESGNWLLVLDNADDKNFTSSWPNRQTDTFNFTIQHYLPRKRGCSILITSRDRHAAFNLVGREEAIIQAHAMTEEEAVELFRKKTTLRPWDEFQAQRLMTQLECIPLAITQAAAYFTQRLRMTIREYLELLHREEARLLSESQTDLRRDINVPHAVIKTWEISFQQIKLKNAEAVDLLFKMSFLDRYGIPVWLLKGEKDLQTAFNEAIETLLRFSFIRVAAHDQQILEIHRLMQLATRTWIMARGELQPWILKALKAVWWQWPAGSFENWRTCQILEPHAEAVMRLCFEWLDLAGTTDDVPSTAAGNDNSRPSEISEEKQWMLLKIKEARGMIAYHRAMFAQQQGHKMRGVEMAELGWNDLNDALSDENPDTLNCGGLLVASYLRVANFEEAVNVGAEVVEKQRILMGPQHPDTLNSLTHFAMAFRGLGFLDEAKHMLSDIVETYKTVGNPDPQTMAMSKNDLALICADQGEYAEVETLLLDVVGTFCQQLGEEHQETLHASHNLALAYRHQGRLDEAQRLLEKTMESKKRVLQRGHPSTMSSMSALAEICFLQYRLQEALELQQTVLANSKVTTGDSSEETSLHMLSLAAIFRRMGNLTEAMKLAEECAKQNENHTATQEARLLFDMMCVETIRKQDYVENGFWTYIKMFGDS